MNFYVVLYVAFSASLSTRFVYFISFCGIKWVLLAKALFITVCILLAFFFVGCDTTLQGRSKGSFTYALSGFAAVLYKKPNSSRFSYGSKFAAA